MLVMSDQLTPREREVADLLRRGLTNEEIASALGITLDGAKYHVSQILSKLGVTSREEVARALSVPTIRPQRSRVDIALLLRLAGATIVAGAVGGVALLGFGVLRTSGSPDTSLTDATGTLQPYVVPTSDFVTGDSQWPTDDPGSDKIEFPDHLAEGLGIVGIPLRAPTDLAIGPDGDLWVTWVGSDGKAVLARNPADTTSVSLYGVPISVRGIDAFVEIDAKGRPVVGSGGQVAVIDPKTLEYKTISMPVAQMLVLDVEGESAFVVPWETDGLALTVASADLETGVVSEIAVPSSFGGVDGIELSPDAIWLLKTADGPNATSRIGRLDRETGDLQVIDRKVRSAGVYGDGLVVVTWDPDSVVLVDSAGQVTPVQVDSLAPYLSVLGIEVPIALDGPNAWIADITQRFVSRIDISSGDAEVILLPSYQMATNDSCPRGADCPDTVTVFTHITATAVSPGGDLYFTDATRQRVGVIRAP
jgi:DNA-binding CsgD family transcriptional regulator